ncbi:phosphotransferase enzyme family protein [Hypoxylon sp. FL0890]|nr:phosphotransferase enzyme family protein [Hypoxylon sp. FL0890]
MSQAIDREGIDQTIRLGPYCFLYRHGDKKVIVKSGSTTRMVEALTMKFVKEHTSIPVPEVIDVWQDGKLGPVRIVMEFIEGDPLDRAWDKFTEEEKTSIITQLRGYFNELRQFHGEFIGGIDMSYCEDPYFASDHGAYGPYEDEWAFNQGLAKAWLTEREDDPFLQGLCDILTKTMTDHKIVLTHNDLDPRNIIVRGSEVVAILDWEQAGFYPEYWEYCRALWRPEWESGWIKDRAVDRILDPYPQELAVIWNTSDIIW